MKRRYQSPGVYVEEISAFPTSIAQVETAIPAFIGYTEKSEKNGIQLLNTPTLIQSKLEFESIFGKGFPSKFKLIPANPSDPYPVKIGNQIQSLSFLPNQQAFLYYSILAFFNNGGSKCKIISVGNYGGKSALIPSKDDFLQGLSSLNTDQESSLVLVPDAVLLGNEVYDIYQQLLSHCGTKRNRFAILDIPKGFEPLNPNGDCVSEFRTQIGNQQLAFGAAYYPWLYSRLVSSNETGLLTHFSAQELQQILPETKAKDLLNSSPLPSPQELHLELKYISPTYNSLLVGIQKKMGLLPPSGFIAGVYARMDNDRGVWNSPANVSLNVVERLAVQLTNNQQTDLNVHGSGKSINAIREFSGKGILVWGARTLAGNDNEWRYVSVRRSVIMIEQSMEKCLQQFVFEPNDANTWTRIRGITENFLVQIWKQGGLQGAKPQDAFYARVGLGQTMTSQDVLDGKLIVEIGMAFVKPAEFIILRIELRLEQS